MADVKAIVDKLERGVKDVFGSDNYKEYLKIMSRFHHYSFGNCILISIQRPSATHVAGFNTWKKLNRNVKKGERGIQILAPCTGKRDVNVTLEDGTVEERQVAYTYFRAAYVFDIEQTEGEELPNIVHKLTGDVDGYDALIAALVAAAPVPVEFGDVPGRASGMYSPARRKIVVRAGMSQAQTVKTLIHEIAHSILHGKGGQLPDADEQTAEVQAESVAYTVSEYLGIDTSEYSFGYIVGWSSGRDGKELKNSLQVIQKTAAEIIDRIEAAA